MVLLALVVCNLTENSQVRNWMFWWAGAVGVSRVVLGRHYVGDVIAGSTVFPLLSFWIQTTYCWLPAERCLELQASLANKVLGAIAMPEV